MSLTLAVWGGDASQTVHRPEASEATLNTVNSCSCSCVYTHQRGPQLYDAVNAAGGEHWQRGVAAYAVGHILIRSKHADTGPCSSSSSSSSSKTELKYPVP
jgi:hypothetical protein